jgi:ligand-binding sensor domain-containing protein/signal transduction histidine kinase
MSDPPTINCAMSAAKKGIKHSIRRQHPALLFGLCALVLGVCLPVSGQLRDLQFQRLHVIDGLSHPDVFEICEDSVGFMWFGAFSGLNRFDGREIKTMDSPSVHALCTDRAGYLWVGTAAGVQSPLCLDFFRDTIYSYGTLGVRAMACEQDGTMWIGSDSGLFRLDRGSTRPVRVADALAESGVNSMAFDKRGLLWIVTRTAILRFNKMNGESQVVCPRSSGRHSSTAVAPDGTIWIAGGDSGEFYKIDPVTCQITEVLENGVRFSADCVAVDSDGIVYVGTPQDGLKAYDPLSGCWRDYRHSDLNPSSLPDNLVHCITIDGKGNLWVGTGSGVGWVARWGKRFVRISLHGNQPDSASAEVRDIAEDAEGNLWLGTIGGVRKWERKTGVVSQVTSARESISALRIAAGKLWWAATSGVKLESRRLSGGGSVDSQQIFTPPGFKGFISSMFSDGDTTLWLGCSRCRLIRCDLRTGEMSTFSYETPEELFPGRIPFYGDDCPRFIVRDRIGVLWIATRHGILKLDETRKAFKRYGHSQKPSFLDNTWCIHEDSQNRMWVGSDLGLDLFDRMLGKFTSVFRSEGRFQGWTVLGILEDRTGYLWLQTDRGLLRYHHDTRDLQRYGPAAGYPMTSLASFFTIGNRAALVTQRKEFVFGVRDAVVMFRPEEIVSDPTQPVVVITSVEMIGGGRTITRSPLRSFTVPGQPLELAAQENALEIFFATLNYTVPTENRYAIWVEPTDRSWSHLGTKNSIRLVNLAPGSYRLRVKGSNSDSTWSTREATFEFRVFPPWWKSMWAYASYALCLALIGYLSYRARVARVRALDQIKMNIAGDLHDELGSGLSSIALQTELLSRSVGLAAENQQRLADVVATARDLANSTRDVVWVLAPSHERLSDLCLKIQTEGQRGLSAIEPVFEVRLEHPDVVLSTGARKHLLMIFKEVLHNIQRHARTDRVHVSIAEQGGKLHLTVRDWGVGFDIARPRCGQGLNNLQFRAQQLGAHCTVTSAPGEGTEVELSVKLTRIRD